MAPPCAIGEPSAIRTSFGGSTPNVYMAVGAECVPAERSELEGPSTSTELLDRSWSVPAAHCTECCVPWEHAGYTEAVLNTSLNASGDPLAYSPADAAHAARKMGLDFLAGDGWVVQVMV